MRALLLFVLGAALLPAQSLTVQVTGVTPQQAILSIHTDGSACTVQVSERADFATLVHDVDPALFQGADACNRVGSIVNGNLITFTAGHRGTDTALTGDIVSRSLQADTVHYYRVQLASGAVASGSFSTVNPPLGNSAPTEIPFNSAGYGNYGWPTLHLDKTSDIFIDPQTGYQVQRLTGPNDEVWWNDNGRALFLDSTVSGWSTGCADPNSGQVYASQNGSNACSYSGPGGIQNALFVRPDYYGDDNYSTSYGVTRFAPTDARLDITGSGPANMQICVTYDHHACIGNPPYDQITMPSSTGAVNSSPNYPNSAFTEFGQNVEVRFEESRQYQDTGSVSISGANLTWTGGGPFPVTILKPGMIVQLFESNGTNYNDYTIASIQDSHHITLTAPVTQQYTSPQYKLVDFGFLIWKDPASTGSLTINSVVLDSVVSTMAGTGAQGSDGNTQCGTPFQLAWDANGNPYPDGPKEAYFCSFQFASSPDEMKVWVPSTGETRKISVMSNVSFGDGLDSQGYLQTCSYNVNDPTYGHYKAYDDGGTERPNPAIGCTRYALAKPVDQLIRDAYPNVDWSYWGRIQFRWGTAGMDMFVFQPYQNAPYIGCIVTPTNTTNPVNYCVLPNDPGPNRWSTSHSAGGGFMVNYTQPYVDWFDHFWSNGNDAPGGQWTIDLSQITGNTSTRGATALDASFAQSCSALGVTNPEWINLESMGDKSCFQATVPHEPVDKTPFTGDYNPAGVDYPKGQLTPLASPALLGSRPAPWPHNSAACGGDGTTTNCWSYFHDYMEGDWAVDPANPSEPFLVAKVTGTTVVFMRAPYYIVGPSTKKLYGNPVDHAAGFQLQMVPYAVLNGGGQAGITYSLATKKPTDWSDYLKDNPDVYGGHVDNWTTSSGADVFIDDFGYYLPNQVGGVGYGVRYGIFPSELSSGFQFGVPDFHPFDGSGAGLGIYEQQVQSHSGGYTYDAPLRETQWAMDFQPYGGPSGGSATLWPTVTTLVPGQQHTYKVSPPATGCGPAGTSAPEPSCQANGYGAQWFSTPDPKRRTTYSGAGPAILRDISGPHSVISDATPFTRCHALLAGECVAGSQPGDEYQSVPGANLYSGMSQINSTDYTPFMNAAGPELAWSYQYGINHVDPFGLNWRHLTMAFAGPTKESNYANIHGNMDGKWGLFEDFFGDGMRSDVFALKLPPWPNTDSISRNTFIPVQVSFYTTTAIQARARFGYQEYSNGSGDNLYCSGERNEECSTVTGDTKEPFAWLSESLPMWQSCAANSTCTITIPALSGRVLYYRLDRQSADGTVTTSSVQAVAVK